MACIDFTASNNDPKINPEHLHHTDDNKKNLYLEALKEVGTILMAYDHDKKLSLYGFGAEIDGDVEHCFNLNPIGEDVSFSEIYSIYTETLEKKNFKLAGPSKFEEILANANCIAKQNKYNKIGNFQIISIILLLIFR